MELYDAIHTVLNSYGKELIAQENLVNYLADYQAFGIKPTRRVMVTFLKDGYGSQVLELDTKNASQAEKEQLINTISMRLQYEEGFQRKHVNLVMNSICYGMGWQLDRLDEDDKEDEESNEILDTNGLVYKHYVTVNGITFVMISVIGGQYDIGATPEQGLFASFDEKPSVKTKVSDFYLAETPVTQALWTAIMGDNPSHFKGNDLPVERVSWEDCQEFIKRLNVQTNIKFRLPTEAEWEYAARGGMNSMHFKYSGANDNDVSDYLWYKENSQSKSHPLKTKLPNELEIYDMSGNISEWCSDWYFNSYANNGDRDNPQGPSTGVTKVYRGGSWDDKAMNCRVSKRFSMNPTFKNKLVGLRLASSKI